MRDREWIREGLGAGFLSMPTIEYRLRETPTEDGEMQIARRAIEQDKDWLDRKSRGADEPAVYKRLVVSSEGMKTFEASLDGQHWHADPATVAPKGLRPEVYDLTRATPVDASRLGVVTGIVIHHDDKHIYQEMGRNNIVRHERRAFAEVPEIGRYKRLQYVDGKAVDAAVQPVKSRGLSR